MLKKAGSIVHSDVYLSRLILSCLDQMKGLVLICTTEQYGVTGSNIVDKLKNVSTTFIVLGSAVMRQMNRTIIWSYFRKNHLSK